MKKLNKSPLATAIGTLVITGFTGSVSADANPFQMAELTNPYMQIAADAGNNKVNSGGCASNVTPSHPHNTAPTPKGAEGSCGEGKCGAMMKDGKMNKGMENSCGAMMKGKEGSCGMMNMNHDDSQKTDKAAEHNCGAMMKNGAASCGAMMSDGAKTDANKAADK